MGGSVFIICALVSATLIVIVCVSCGPNKGAAMTKVKRTTRENQLKENIAVG